MPRPSFRLALRALTLALVAGCGGPPEAAEEGSRTTVPPPWSIDTAPVLFGATRAGRVDLWRYDPVARDTVMVRGGDASEVGPRLDPSGTRLLYHERTSGVPFALLLATEDTTRVLRASTGHDLGGVWSPDGTAVAYFSSRDLEAGDLGEFPGHVWVIDLATGRERRITDVPLPSSLGPTDWSPDGRWLLAARRFDGQLDLVRIDVATGAEERLTSHPDDEYSAVWSSDGERIAFHAESDTASQVVILDVVTGRRRELTRGGGWRYAPSWSPDDTWLLVTASDDGEQYDVVAVHVADGREQGVVVTAEDERYGIWIPPGSPWTGRRR